MFMAMWRSGSIRLPVAKISAVSTLSDKPRTIGKELLLPSRSVHIHRFREIRSTILVPLTTSSTLWTTAPVESMELRSAS